MIAINNIRFHKKNVPSASELNEAELEYIDITLLLKGTMHYTINQEPVILHSGDVIVYQPGDIRKREQSKEVEYWSFNIKVDETDNLPFFHGVLRQCLSDELQLILDLIVKISTKDSPYTDRMFWHSFLLLYYHLYDRSQKVIEDDNIVKIKNYIDTHLSEPLTLPQICNIVYLSPNYCNYLFKKYTGETITSYVIRKKMECAKEYLINTDMPLANISTALGYRHYSYFSRQFKKLMNITPLELRQTHMYVE